MALLDRNEYFISNGPYTTYCETYIDDKTGKIYAMGWGGYFQIDIEEAKKYGKFVKQETLWSEEHGI